MPKISVVGSINMDLVIRTPRFPEPGETIAGSDFHMFPGGKGANQAVAIARMGGEVIMIGRVGNDPFGQQLLSTLNQEGIEIQHVVKDPDTSTGVAMVVVDSSGENRIILTAGANGRLSLEDIDAAATVIANSDMLVCQFEVPLETTIHAIEIAQKHHVPVVLNPAPAQELPTNQYININYLIPNESELSLLADQPYVPKSSNEHLIQLSDVLLSKGVNKVIVTLGNRGAMISDDTGSRFVPGFLVPVVDTTAAGDSFVGAFSFALASGKSTLDAVTWANAAGALAATKLGAQPSIPSSTSVIEFLSSRELTGGSQLVFENDLIN